MRRFIFNSIMSTTSKRRMDHNRRTLLRANFPFRVCSIDFHGAIDCDGTGGRRVGHGDGFGDVKGGYFLPGAVEFFQTMSAGGGADLNLGVPSIRAGDLEMRTLP